MKTRIFIDQEIVKKVKKYVKLPKVEGEKQKYEKQEVEVRSIVRTTKEWQDNHKHYADIEKDPAKKARKELKSVKTYTRFKLKWFGKEIEKQIFVHKRRKKEILRKFKIKVYTRKAILQPEVKSKFLKWITSQIHILKPKLENIRFLVYRTSEKDSKPYEFESFYEEIDRKNLENRMLELNNKYSNNDFSNTYRFLEARNKYDEFIMKVMKSYLGSKKVS